MRKKFTEYEEQQAKVIYLLLHNRKDLEKWLKNQHPPISAFAERFRHLLQTIKQHYEEHNELLTQLTYRVYLKEVKTPKDRIRYEMSYNMSYVRVTDSNEYSLYADSIAKYNELKINNDALHKYNQQIKNRADGSYVELLKSIVNAIPDPDDQSTIPIEQFERLYCPLLAPPVSALPKVCRDYIKSYTDVLTVPADFILLPMLAAIGSAAGKYYRFFAENSNYVRYPNIWTSIIGEPGLKKTTALNDIIAGTRKHDIELDAMFKRAVKAYKRDYKDWEQDDKKGKKPSTPTRRQCTFDQTTIQNFYNVLRNNPRGLLLKQDEISKFIKKMITDNDGSLETFLEIYTYGDVDYCIKGNSASKHERTINHEFYDIKVPNPCLTIIGGVQPAKLSKLLNLLDDDGFSSRFMIAYPDSIEDTDYDYNRQLNNEYMTAYNDLIKSLLSLKLDEGKQFMQTVTLIDEPAVIDKYNQVCNKYGKQIKEYGLQGNIKYTLRKARDFFVRLALIVHIIRYHTNEITDQNHIDLDTIIAAEKITDYVIAHYYKFFDGYKTIFKTQNENETQDAYQKIKKWVMNNGKAMPIRTMIANRIFASAKDAKHGLRQFVKQKKGFYLDSDKQDRFISI